MRHYYVYLIEEEFASHYFGKEAKIFDLIRHYQWTSVYDGSYNVLERQVQYISRDIPSRQIHELLTGYLSLRKGYRQVGHLHRIVLSGEIGQATLMIKERYIEIDAQGSFEAETIFFEILRKLDPCFLAMDFQSQRFGWLNPISERKFV
ncbi:sporulation inhibitor of replication protein SirA [Bacillus sp. FJAT-42376]|uniref:sporulation inhibitor of replication protein SirA n=1 Tax=Bacillus sp. FJAT-42376 TaxID=2014076 RepID=UPI000F4E83F5|nr:sporulation inhibitor of replication protein SirA [Bacillus sp. FJAT-42376]AZB43048.1 sporulation inhibitor of replication protein SirA [Bacillus sp. FJAT-42376]